MAGIQIPIEVVDKFSKQLNDLDKKMGALTDSAQKQNKSFNLLAADVVVRYGREAIGAIVKFGEDCLKSFAESEKAVNRLDQAIKAQGITAKGYSLALQEQASALEAVTTRSDEAILETQTLLTTFGLAGKELKGATKATLDLASGLGIDLRSATMLIGKAWVGETGSLGRFGIKIDETKKGAAAFGEVMKQVQDRFGGAAQAEAQTYAGRVEVLANKFDNLKEKVGSFLVGPANQWTEWLTTATNWVNKQIEGENNLGKSKDKVLVSMRLHIQQLKDEVDAYGSSTVRGKLKQIELDKEAKAYENLVRIMKAKGQIGKEIPVAEPKSKAAPEDMKGAIASQKERMELAQSAQAKFDQATLSKDTLLQIEDEKDAALISKSLGRDQADEFMHAKALAREKLYSAAKLQATQTALSAISTLSQSKNKELALIGKAAASANIIVSTATGVMQAWALGPILGPILAPLVAIAGAAQLATVAGVQLAEGGIVKARPGGVRATIGEGGRDEAVIPLGDSAAKKRLARELGGGGGVNINVGGIVVNLSGSVDRSMAAKLAEEIRAETVDSIRLALRLSNIATANAGVAA